MLSLSTLVGGRSSELIKGKSEKVGKKVENSKHRRIYASFRRVSLDNIRHPSRKRSRYIFSDSSDWIFLVDPRGRFIEVSDIASVWTGYGIAELKSMTIGGMIPEDERPAMAAALRRLMYGQSASATLSVRKKDGAMLSLKVKMRQTSDGMFQGIAYKVEESQPSGKSVAECPHAMAENLANTERLQNVIEAMPLGAAIVDEHQEILHVNTQFCLMFGLQVLPSSMAGGQLDDITAMMIERLEQPECYLKRLADSLKRREASISQELQLRDGRILLQDYIPINVDKLHRGHLLLYRDVTHQRRIDATKTEFMSLASHQLRTPLTAIRWALGRLDKMMGNRLDDKERMILQEGRNAAARMANTIATMLSISRIESGSLSPAIGPVRIIEVLDDVCHAHHEQYSRRGQKIYINCPDGLQAYTDPNLLKEVVSNLIGNAVKYSPGNSRIFIRAMVQSGRTCIEVQDSGIGIPIHQQDRVFSRFFRADNTVKAVTDGTGLGLYLVSLLMKALGGRISFTSAEGKGTTFTVCIPAFPA